MENASDGCVKKLDQTSKILSKLATDDSKLKHANPYVNKPIFRRRLIEKYSTARYNINTKRVLVKVSPPSQSCGNDETHKRPHESDSRTENAAKNSSVSSKGDHPSTVDTGRTSINARASAKNSRSNFSPVGAAIGDKKASSCSSATPGELTGVTDTKQNYSPRAKKIKLSSSGPSSSSANGTWKIAPKSIYNHLWDMYQNADQVKTETETEEPKKEAKKRRPVYSRTKKRSRKKPVSCQKTSTSTVHFDPYAECLEQVETPSKSTFAGSGDQKLGIVMYLGVDRPLFPLVYRNLRVLNDSNDEKITDFWAEFALSTLITKGDERKCKPVLVPIKDAKLATLVSECVDATVVRSKRLDVSSKTSISGGGDDDDDDATDLNDYPPPVLVKQEETHVEEPKPENQSPPPPVEKPSKSNVVSAKNCRKRVKESENKLADGKAEKSEAKLNETVAKIERVCEDNVDEEKSTPKKDVEENEQKPNTEELKQNSRPADAERRSRFDENKRKPKLTLKAEENMLENIINRSKRMSAGPKSKSRSRVAAPSQPPKLEEKSVLKKFGYKECFVAIPKLSDTLIKYLSAGNYSNQSAELSDPTERELIEETDDFGLIQCTRTDGIIIDYVKRNRSLVYFYKLKKMLDFQKTNNKYFVCCDYVLIERAKNDENIDIVSFEEEGDGDDDDDDASDDNKTVATSAVRSSRNPNDLFKTSKLSEWKNKSNNICWVKNHDLKLAAGVKWLLISLDKLVASLSHASGCVLRYRLLFEIIYRAELSKKVICCQITKLPEGSDEKLAFGVYAFPGLCDKVLVGPYSYHEQHQLSVFVRTNDGYSERAHIKTLEEKENFPQLDESRPSKHINAKWWSGRRSSDLTEQYLNFFFNPAAVKCVPQADKINLARIIGDHPCFNYHSYEISGRESNLVLFHDRTNAIEKSAVATTEIPAIPDTVGTNVDVNDTIKEEPLTAAPKQSRNLRKKPRMDYSQLVTDDMAIPVRGLRIVDVKSLRNRGSRPDNGEGKAKSKRSRYHESPQVHIMNERLRRLEFRNRRNNLASVLETRPSGPNNTHSLVSILIQAKEIITYLTADNERLDEEGKRLRAEQSSMMRKLLAQLRNLDINSVAYKSGMAFVSAWKKIKANHRNRLIEMLGQNFDKSKATKAATESSKISAAASSALLKRSSTIRTVQRFESNMKKTSVESGKKESAADCGAPHSKEEDAAQRLNLRKKRRQKLRDVYRKRNNNAPQKDAIETMECEISEEVVNGDGTSSHPLRRHHVDDKVGEIPIVVSNVPAAATADNSNAVDPLAGDDEDEDGATSSFDQRSKGPGKEPPHPLYYEHNYCSVDEEPSIDLTIEPDKRIPIIPIRGRPAKTSDEPTFSFLNRNRANIAKNLAASSLQRLKHKPMISATPTPAPAPTILTQRRRNPILATGSPILKNRSATLPHQKNPITAAAGSVLYDSRRNNSIGGRTSTRLSTSASPTFQITVKKTADDNLCLDIIDNGRVFARLNVAKVGDGVGSNDAACSSRDASLPATGVTTYSKIMTIIQRFLQQMEKTSPVFTCAEGNDDERAKQAKRRHVVNSLRSFISKFEHRRKTVEDGGYSSSSRASNSDGGGSPPYVADNIELDDGYSSKGSEASYDRDQDIASKERPPQTVTLVRNRVPNDGNAAAAPAIENIVLDDSSDESHDEEIVREDELIAEEEEEEEIVGEEELIEEEEAEEEIVGEGNTLEEINDVVDAAMRFDEGDRFGDSPPSAEEEEDDDDDDEDDSMDTRVEQSTSTNPSPQMLFTNKFIIRSKDKFVPNIMKTPTKMAETTSVDHLSRINIKPSVGSVVKLSNGVGNETTSFSGSSTGGNDSIIKRLWYSPVTKTESDMKILRRESNLNDTGKSGNLHDDKSANNDDDEESKRDDEMENSADGTTETVAEAEQDSSDNEAETDSNAGNRIVIKSFANHNKFQKAFLSNVDKLLNPES